ncbi:hypothetical protein C9374_005098 [Naegleria lovaniensis]|uniref:Uncharacterized protein n=1 Tax=Naegleria lovaniensis TaxID=51637 RepID=A0AA88KK34_NAELO|nr:uncharacterized protein C9374_005098 [Naegleria lovaniensis]KAG2382518.1 hypothetical protein C9374_005098 [Naegleria lovaniensis]
MMMNRVIFNATMKYNLIHSSTRRLCDHDMNQGYTRILLNTIHNNNNNNNYQIQPYHHAQHDNSHRSILPTQDLVSHHAWSPNPHESKSGSCVFVENHAQQQQIYDSHSLMEFKLNGFRDWDISNTCRVLQQPFHKGGCHLQPNELDALREIELNGRTLESLVVYIYNENSVPMALNQWMMNTTTCSILQNHSNIHLEMQNHSNIHLEMQNHSNIHFVTRDVMKTISYWILENLPIFMKHVSFPIRMKCKIRKCMTSVKEGIVFTFFACCVFFAFYLAFFGVIFMLLLVDMVFESTTNTNLDEEETSFMNRKK